MRTRKRAPSTIHGPTSEGRRALHHIRYTRSALFAALTLAFFSVGFRFESESGLVALANMYLYDSLLLLSDQQTGIHVYSVADRASPRFKMTIPLMGNTGLAAKGDVVYANSYGSILALRIHDDSLYDVAKVLVGEPRYLEGNDVYYGGMSCMPFGCTSAPVSSGDASSGGGTGGSYALFALIDNYLYYVNGQEVVAMDISTPDNPRELSRTYVDWSLETIFPTRDYLFVGGTTGMYILDRGNPAYPTKIGQVSHFRSCDPVVVSNSIAYVTLRSGNACGQSGNVLMSVDIADPRNPRVLQEKDVAPPYGLTVRDSSVLVGFGSAGFALFNVSNPSSMTQTASWGDVYGRDFIWADSTLYVMGASTVVIYDASDPSSPVKVSAIE